MHYRFLKTGKCKKTDSKFAWMLMYLCVSQAGPCSERVRRASVSAGTSTVLAELRPEPVCACCPPPSPVWMDRPPGARPAAAQGAFMPLCACTWLGWQGGGLIASVHLTRFLLTQHSDVTCELFCFWGKKQFCWAARCGDWEKSGPARGPRGQP